MKLTPVTSSNIKAVGHKDGVLYVEFKGGKAFRYEDVSKAKYGRFLSSESVGSFFARNIRNNHKASEVKPEIECAKTSCHWKGDHCDLVKVKNDELSEKHGFTVSDSVCPECGHNEYYELIEVKS